MTTTYAWNSTGAGSYQAGVNLWGGFFPSANKWSPNLASNYVAALNDGYPIDFVANCTQYQQVVFANSGQTVLVSIDGGAVQTITAGVTGTQTLTMATGLAAGNHLFRVVRNGTGITFGDILLTGGTEQFVSKAKGQTLLNKSAITGTIWSPGTLATAPAQMWGAHKAFSSPAQAVAMSEYNGYVVEGRFDGASLDALNFYESNMHVAVGIDGAWLPNDVLLAPGGASGLYAYTNLVCGLSAGTHRYRLYITGGASGNSIWTALRATNARALASGPSGGATSITLDSAPSGWAAGHWIKIGRFGNVGNSEWRQIDVSYAGGSTIPLTAALTNAHAAGDPVWNSCDPTTGGFSSPDETIGVTSRKTDLSKIYHPQNGKVTWLGDSIGQMKSADLEGTPGPDGSPVYLTYDNRASYVDMYAELAGLEFINLCHQGDATAQMVSRAADFATMNTTGCTKWGMLIGTNDANTSVTTTVYGTNLSSIIDSFVGAAPVNSVILTSHIFSPTNKDITGYNGQIDSTAPTKQTANPNYLFPVADFATTANLVLNANPGGDMQDALHLNSTGAAKIRDALPAMFASVVPGSPSQPGAATGNVQITLTWLAVTNATAYEVYRDGVTKIFDGNALTYTDNVAGGSTHSYTVKAKNGLGTSAPSAGRSIAANVGGGGGGGAGGAAGGRLSIGL